MGKLRNILRRARIENAALVAALGTFAFGGVFVGDAASQETATSGSRALAVVAKDAGKCGALLVGVDEYETLTPLEYASSDVRKLRAALVEIGFPSETIRTFVSDGRIRERPSRARILAALDEILAASGPDSTVLIALSGHGFETENGDAAFCPEDVVAKKNGDKTLVKSETAILIDDVAACLRQDDARFKLLIVDACREPASTEKGATSKTRSFPSISEARGVAFLQSCETQEFSWEHSELKGGVFTHFFAEGLRGAADSDGDGGVSFLDVCNYATSQTQRFVRDKRDASQTPFYRFSGVVDFWLKPPTRTGGGTTGGGVNVVAEADYRKGRELAFGLNGTKIDGRRGAALLTKATDAGSIDAQAELAELYWVGCEGTPVDEARAYGLAFEAAQNENPFALRILGLCCERGRVVAKDEKQAAAYFARAFRGFEKRAKSGDVRAKMRLGGLLTDGKGRQKDEAAGFELIREAAETGCAEATNNLGVCYEFGTGVAKDATKAVELYRKASDAGCATAMNNLGVHYANGSGVERDETQAFEWYRKASDAGNAAATAGLGLCYEKGTGVAKDVEKAFELYRKASDAGNARATYNLGVCYAKGRGVAKDVEKAFELYRKASDAGNAAATCSLANCYYNGTGVERDYDEAFRWYKEGADAGDATAMNNLGVCYEKGRGVAKDVEKAFELYRKASDAGDARATNNLGVCYENGTGVAKDVEKAVELYRKASDAGCAQATNNLGVCYERGIGVVKDEGKAFEFYRKAMYKGHIEATNNLGVCYERGTGVEKDVKKAFELYRQASEAGNVLATRNLGVCYENGTGVAKDVEKAFELYRKASDAGNARAMNNLAACYEQGTGVAKDVDEAKRLYRKAAESDDESQKTRAEEALRRLGE